MVHSTDHGLIPGVAQIACIIGTLGRVSLEDMPRYLKILHGFPAPELTNSEYTEELLSTLVRQGSVENAQEYVERYSSEERKRINESLSKILSIGRRPQKLINLAGNTFYFFSIFSML